jgi:predicted outer membrane repeat protein
MVKLIHSCILKAGFNTSRLITALTVLIALFINQGVIAQSHTFPSFTLPQLVSGTTGETMVLNTAGLTADYITYKVEANFTGSGDASTAWSNSIEMEMWNNGAIIYKDSTTADAGKMSNGNPTVLVWTGVLKNKYTGPGNLSIRFHDEYHDTAPEAPYLSTLSNIKVTIYEVPNAVTLPTVNPGTLTSAADVTTALNTSNVTGEYMFYEVSADFDATSFPLADQAWSNSIQMALIDAANSGHSLLVAAGSGANDNPNATTLKWTGLLVRTHQGTENLSIQFHDNYNSGGPYSSIINNVQVTLYEVPEHHDFAAFNIGQLQNATPGTTFTLPVSGLTDDYLYFQLDADFTANYGGSSTWSNSIGMEISNSAGVIFQEERHADFGDNSDPSPTTLYWGGVLHKEYVGGQNVRIRFYDSYNSSSDPGPYYSDINNVNMTIYTSSLGASFLCPTVGNLSASETVVCANEDFDLTADGLNAMGAAMNGEQDFGIIFKSHGNAQTDPYMVGGEYIDTVSFAQLSMGGMEALGNGSIATQDATTFIYAILTPTPTEPSCRPFASTTIDVGGPMATCQHITVYLDDDGVVTADVNDVNNGSTSPCGIDSMWLSQDTFRCADAPTTNIILTVRDAVGNLATCSSTVSVEDTVAPIAICQDITVYLNGSGIANIFTSDINNGSTDNCGISSLSVSPSSFNCSNLGSNSVVLTASDAAGNSDTCHATVMVIDSLPPQITCPGNQTETFDASCQFVLPDYTALLTISDNCGTTASPVQTPPAGSVIHGDSTILMTVQDGSGNVDSCTFDVIRNDAHPPMAVCVDVTVYLNGLGHASIQVNDIDGGSSDNCGSVSFSLSESSFTCNDIGQNLVILTATDGNANTDTCHALVEVVDTFNTTKFYVDSTVLGGDGLSWATAFNHLQDALTSTCLHDGDTICVAKGTYYPDEGVGFTDNARDSSFYIPSGVVVLGGFPTGGGNLASRDWEAHKTILSGDIDQTIDSLNNAYHVVTTTKASSNTYVDGLCIVNGNADTGSGSASNTNNNGGGWFNNGANSNAPSNPTIVNCRFENNTARISGGALHNDGQNGACSTTLQHCFFAENRSGFGGAIANIGSGFSSPSILNCRFLDNQSLYGGAILNSKCTLIIKNCAFERNIALMIGTGTQGGAIHNTDCETMITNCIFSENSSTSGGAVFNQANDNDNITMIRNCIFIENSAFDGGAVFNQANSDGILTIITNCTFSKNQASSGAAIRNQQVFDLVNVKVANSILWDNGLSPLANNGGTTTITYSLFEGPFPTGTDSMGMTNKHVDPLFISPTDLRLDACSPAINSGFNDSIPAGVTVDLDGNARIIETTVDMGAYEYQVPYVDLVKFYVDSSASPGGDGSSWAMAFNKLQDALTSTCLHDGDTICVAKGTYYPDEGAGQTDNDQNSLFDLKNGVILLGGFSPAEGASALADRDWTLNETILSGDIDQNSDTTNNAYHVVRADGAGAYQIDGFSITGGNATSGVLTGGGLCHVNQVVPEVWIRNCNFHHNYAKSNGGGIYLEMEDPHKQNISNCNFERNHTDLRGGGIYVHPTNPGGTYNDLTYIMNCRFYRNSSTQNGAVLGITAVPNLGTKFINCSATGNTDGIHTNSPLSIENSILWGNGSNEIWGPVPPTVANSIVKGGYAGAIDTDPFFIRGNAGNLRLNACSPAINSGNNGFVLFPTMPDLDGNGRIFETTVDMGAYEYQLTYVDLAKFYVDSSASPGGDGSSWAMAFNKLQDALTSTCLHDGDTVCVAQGTYYPDEGVGFTDNARDSSFHIPSGVVVLGGFPSGGGTLAARDWEAHKTILSGDIDQTVDNFNNAYHVVTTTKATASTYVDGLWIVHGNANTHGGGWLNNGTNSNAPSNPTIVNCSFKNNAASGNGGGLFNDGQFGECSPTLQYCIFSENRSSNGGAIANSGSNQLSSPHILNCRFLDNLSRNGGAIYGSRCTLTIKNCEFKRNIALATGFGTSGGAINSDDCVTMITNCVFSENSSLDGGAIYNRGDGIDNITMIANCAFSDNSASSAGGAIFNDAEFDDVFTTLTNCTFSGNQSNSGSVILNRADYYGIAVINIANSILWDNGPSPLANIGASTTTITYSIFEGPFPSGTDSMGMTNKHVDPLFISPMDLRLEGTSPAIDMGYNDSIPAGITTDLDGNVRIFNGTVDMGAYELICTPFAANTNPISVYLDGYGQYVLTQSDKDSLTSGTAGDELSIKFSQDTFSCTDLDSVSIDVTIYDTCTQQGAILPATVFVLDTIRPILTLPADYTATQMDPNSCNVELLLPLSLLDNCGIDSLQFRVRATDLPGNCGDPGQSWTFIDPNAPVAPVVPLSDGYYEVCWRVMDASGNYSIQSNLVTVVDLIDPMPFCNGNVNITLGANGMVMLDARQFDIASVDNCTAYDDLRFSFSGVAPTDSTIILTCADLGSHNLTLWVWDEAGNKFPCTAGYTLNDLHAPMPMCHDITVTLDSTGNYSLTSVDSATVTDGTTDACSAVQSTLSQLDFTCSDLGAPVSVIVTYSDMSGNTSMCTSQITVKDESGPLAMCHDISVTLDDIGLYTLSESDSLAIISGTMDVCTTFTASFSERDFDCGTSSNSSRMITVTYEDAFGNLSNCDATITLVDTTAPVAQCFARDVYLDHLGNYNFSSADSVAIVSTTMDLCSGFTTAFSRTSFDCADVGAAVDVTITYTDVSMNSSTCVAAITVLDTLAPTTMCADITIELDATGNYILSPADSIAMLGMSSDNCLAFTASLSQRIFSCADVGNPASVTITLTDAFNNTSQCSSTVTVLDVTIPVIACKNVNITLDGSGEAILHANSMLNTSSNDACGGPLIVSFSPSDMNENMKTIDCSFVGAFHVDVPIYVWDASGNMTSCIGGVKADDDLPPMVVCHEITVTLDTTGAYEWTASDSMVVVDGTTDNCDELTTSFSKTSFSCGDVGVHNVTVTVSDGDGNSSTCLAMVTVQRPAIIRAVWSGAVDTNWFEEDNWQSGCVPGPEDDVLIPIAPNFPEIKIGESASIRTIDVELGAIIVVNGELLVEN